jgi:hypothetical protein
MRILNERLNLSVLQAPNHASDILETSCESAKKTRVKKMFICGLKPNDKATCSSNFSK